MRTLGLLFTRGVSLKIWVETGLFEREKAIYEYGIERKIYKKVFWFTYGKNDKELGDKLIKEGKLNPNIIVVQMPKYFSADRWGYDFYSILMPFAQKKYFMSIDIIKSNQMDGAWTGIIVKKTYKIPFYFRTGYTYTRFYERMNHAKNKKFMILEKKLYQMCDIASVTSAHDKNYVCGQHKISSDKIVVIHNYVDCSKFYNMHFERLERAVFIGRLTEQKNLFNTILAMKDTGIGLDIYGGGDLERNLKEYIKRENVDVLLKGSVPNDELPYILNKYRYFILASYYEGMPKTLIEGMACGNLCIGTKVEGINEVIKDGINGYLSDGVTATDIHKAIIRAISDKDKAGKVVCAIKMMTEEYSLECILRKESEICINVIKQYDKVM